MPTCHQVQSHPAIPQPPNALSVVDLRPQTSQLSPKHQPSGRPLRLFAFAPSHLRPYIRVSTFVAFRPALGAQPASSSDRNVKPQPSHHIRRERVIVTTRQNQSTALPARAAHAASSLLQGQCWKEGFKRWRGDCVNGLLCRRSGQLNSQCDDGRSVRRCCLCLKTPVPC